MCDGLARLRLSVRSGALVQSWGGRPREKNNMETGGDQETAEYQDWGDWGDYGQHWGVDRVKLQFKTGQAVQVPRLLGQSTKTTRLNFEFLCLSH